MKKVILFFFIAGINQLKAQSLKPEVISSAGGFDSISSKNVSWTLGEIITDTYTGQNSITKGFHQPAHIALNSVNNPMTSDGGIYVYPNPVQNALSVDFRGMKCGLYTIIIYDELGKTLGNKTAKIEPGEHVEKLDLSLFANGIYYVKVENKDSKTTKLFKIIRQK